MTDATTLLFGLPGVRVERVERRADGTRVVDVLSAEETAAACPSCGVVSTSVKGRVITSPRDIPYGEDRIVVRWNKIRWRCREDYCRRKSFTEVMPQVPARARSTLRLRQQTAKAIGEAARSVAEVAAAHGVSWPTAHRAFVAHADEALTTSGQLGTYVFDILTRLAPTHYCDVMRLLQSRLRRRARAAVAASLSD
jgi:transposase